MATGDRWPDGQDAWDGLHIRHSKQGLDRADIWMDLADLDRWVCMARGSACYMVTAKDARDSMMTGDGGGPYILPLRRRLLRHLLQDRWYENAESCRGETWQIEGPLSQAS